MTQLLSDKNAVIYGGGGHIGSGVADVEDFFAADSRRSAVELASDRASGITPRFST